MFLQKHTSQQHGDCRIERGNYNSFIETTGLAGSDEEDGAERIDATGE
jgi:hypothetical protein